ncbi:MAG: sugar ABC transporter permease [Anaerolineales bacterium]|nr:sugar ABC transporter permease [Anaerolineales bacterium]
MSASRSAPPSLASWLASGLGRLVLALAVPGLTFLGLWQGFLFLRDSDAPKLLIALVAIIWGVGGAGLLYLVSNWLVEQLPAEWVRRLQPFLFIGPAMAILIWFLALPTLRTLWISLFNANSSVFVGLQNYLDVLTQQSMLDVFRNNLLWMVLGTSFTVVFGLLVAVLADRSRFETLAKSIIFMPMAISFVGAGVIWNFVYEVKDKADPQIGLLNAIWVALGNEPQAWTALITPPFNSLFLIVIVIWLQTGYAMVLFSAAIKGVPGEILEAAQVDGANDIQVFFQIMIPQITGTIITVTTTVIIFTLKIFDVVWVMTGGQFGTSVIATEFYRQYFTNRNFGYGSAIAIILLIAVIPVMIYNLRQFKEREAF